MILSGISDEAGSGIAAQIRAHQELGWRHMELRAVEGELVSMMSEDKFDALYGAVAEADMEVSCFSSGIANWSRFISGDPQIDYAELRRSIPRMHRFNTRYIRIMSYPNDQNNPLTEPEWRREVFRRMRELLRIAEDGGVVLAHENCSGWGGESPENSRVLITEMNSRAFQVLFDTGNPIPHGQDAWAYYSAVRDNIIYVHIKDAHRLPDGTSQYCYCGEGAGCVAQILADLHARGYRGFVSIEPHVAAVIHAQNGPVPEEVKYASYMEYGRRLERIVGEVQAC